MSTGKLFEAFFWLEPGKADPNGVRSTKNNIHRSLFTSNS